MKLRKLLRSHRPLQVRVKYSYLIMLRLKQARNLFSRCAGRANLAYDFISPQVILTPLQVALPKENALSLLMRLSRGREAPPPRKRYVITPIIYLEHNCICN